MKLPFSVLISALIHLVVVGWVCARELFREDVPVVAVETTPVEIVTVPPPPAVEPPPVARPDNVQFLDEATTEVVKPLPIAPAKKTSRPRVASVSRGGTGTTMETSGTTNPGAPTTREPGTTRNPLMDMRRGSRVDLTLPATRDDLDRVPAGTTPQQGVAPTGQLEDSAGGRKKSDQNVFVAKVDRDGSVRIVDKRNLSAETSWNPAKLLAGRFDVTDYLMRKTKNDPYSSRKLKFLDDTRDERVEIGKQWRQQQLQQTSMIIRKNIERAWASTQDFAGRKRALFELWDEITEPKSRDDLADEVLVEATRVARQAVVGFIRAKLPAGSEHAYTETELLAFNAKKQSTQKFAPYE